MRRHWAKCFRCCWALDRQRNCHTSSARCRNRRATRICNCNIISVGCWPLFTWNRWKDFSHDSCVVVSISWNWWRTPNTCILRRFMRGCQLSGNTSTHSWRRVMQTTLRSALVYSSRALSMWPTHKFGSLTYGTTIWHRIWSKQLAGAFNRTDPEVAFGWIRSHLYAKRIRGSK